MMRRVMAVDLDGTLAYYDDWKGIEHIGKPIPAMMMRVKLWLMQGHKVIIFTARAEEPEAIPYIKKWLIKYGLGNLKVTNIKTMDISEIWDDRAVQIEQNTGRRVDGKQ